MANPHANNTPFDAAIAALDSLSHPLELADVLDVAGQRMLEAASELAAAWQDKQAGRGWALAGRRMQALASSIGDLPEFK